MTLASIVNAAPAPSRRHGQPLWREDLTSGSLRDIYLRSELANLAWSDAQLRRSMHHTLRSGPPAARTVYAAHRVGTPPPRTTAVWVFAYGSLIWNPLFPVAEQRIATIYGYHRSVCLWSHLGRGTRDNPGLVLGLDNGGACGGLVLRIDAAHAHDELSLLWRREMVTGAYAPAWVPARTSLGTVNAIAFVIDHHSHTYAGRLPEADIAANIRSAAGMIGPCSEYLEKTAAGLKAHGIRDERLARLAVLCGCAA